MNKHPVVAIMMVFAAVLGIGVLGGGLTGNASGASLFGTSTVLSVACAMLAIGVLIVAGLQTTR